MEIKCQCMPRCSSLKNLSKQSYEQSEKNTNYYRWKQALEGDFKMKTNRNKPDWWQRLDAISGHLTPKGHPSFTYKNLTSLQYQTMRQNKTEIPLMNVNEHLRDGPKVTAISSQQQHEQQQQQQQQQQAAIKSTLTSLSVRNLTIKSLTRHHCRRFILPSLPLPSLTHLTYSEQAKIIERLYSDIKKFEKSLST
ncbi:hypothetical protein GQX74_008157 [Glossina fuscipes]|nr:hypothetical protein GQX74_008157 [Glossina fuscipes]